MHSTNRRYTRSALTFLCLATGVALSTTGGCSCNDGGGLGEAGPKIVAIPNPVVFDNVSVGIEASVNLLLKNDGNAPLVIEGEATLVEGSEDQETELILRRALLPVDCNDLSERAPDDPARVAPGECLLIEVVYLPANIGPDTGTITVKSNDPKTRTLEIPIQAKGAAPDIEVCVLQSACSDQEVCYQAGDDPLHMDFSLVQINDSVTCPVRISNTGGLPLTSLSWTFRSGNRRKEYVLDPEDLSSVGDIAPGEGIEVNITLTPRTGGPKQAEVEIASTDPDEGSVVIRLDGMGDGPRLCPDPFPVLDFGQVGINTTASLEVTLENCGTMALDVTKLQVQDQTGQGPSSEFALGASAPGMPQTLQPGDTLTVPVDFTPPTVGYFTGRLYLESTDPAAQQGWVNLLGEGILPPACILQPTTTNLAFGSAAPSNLGGTPVEKTLVLANSGQLPCTGITAQITAGQNVSFALTGLPSGGPPWSLDPGKSAVFSLTYDPADTQGPDQGTLTFDAAELQTPVDVTLTGTPVQAPTCDLAVTPKQGNFSFSECAVLAGFTPRVAQYGAVKIGQDKTIPITLENIGTAMCTVTSITEQSVIPFAPPDPTFTVPTTMLVGGTPSTQLSPGQIGEIPVVYAPVGEQSNCAAVWIQTNNTAHPSECMGFGGGNDGCYNVSLMGQGVRSAIEVLPADVDFGVVTVGCSSRDTQVTIYNIGQAPMNITNITTDPNPGPFIIVAAPSATAANPYVLNGGQSVTIQVKYTPPDTNTHTGLLVIESDAQNGSYFTVPLKGQGTTDSHQTDTFQQLSEPMVDVLWVIDNSCSMSEEQNAIANNGNTFLQHALSLSTDFQIGVVTTDMDDPSFSGKLVSSGGAPKIITRTTPNAAGEFGKNIKQGTSGSGTEKGLDAAHAALTEPLLSNENAGFLRDDAKLVVIAVSDEDDQSVPPVDFFVDFLKNIKGYRNTDLMSFSAVVGYDESSGQASSCTSNNGDASAGTRYIEVATRTGGIKRSICSSNWGQIANDLGLDAFGAKTQFFLTRDPVPSSISVTVNGSTVPASGNWSYDASSNSIVFEPAAVPAQGATVVVDYDTICY